MSTFSTFIYTGGGLLLVLLLLFIIPKLKIFFKSRKRKEKNVVEVKKEIHEKKIIVSKRSLIKVMIGPFVLVMLLGLFFIFEMKIVDFVKGYAIELFPINYVALFTILGLIFIAKGAILNLKSEQANNLKAFIWIMQGFGLSMIALCYELFNSSHIVLFGMKFNFLMFLLVIWEFVVLVSIVGNYKKVC